MTGNRGRHVLARVFECLGTSPLLQRRD
ncbi:uncharacterized protein METZ01_LOCUS290960 [marine metagenome]|uniref:Uncharacterized protein n=1 Tax=marine metagenome TaxID=408172 RepID=A0A382LNH4_9ZZZZ